MVEELWNKEMLELTFAPSRQADVRPTKTKNKIKTSYERNI